MLILMAAIHVTAQRDMKEMGLQTVQVGAYITIILCIYCHKITSNNSCIATWTYNLQISYYRSMLILMAAIH